MSDSKPLRQPIKLQAIRKQLELRLERRKIAREILLPKNNGGLMAKLKDMLSNDKFK